MHTLIGLSPAAHITARRLQSSSHFTYVWNQEAEIVQKASLKDYVIVVHYLTSPAPLIIDLVWKLQRRNYPP